MLKRIVLSIFMLTSVSISILAQQQETMVVSRDGTGKYRTIQEAVEAVRAFMDYTVTIYIKIGLYKEKLVIPSWLKNVQIVGESA